MRKGILLILLLLGFGSGRVFAQNQVPLFDGPVPGNKGNVNLESATTSPLGDTIILRGVSIPTITAYIPPKENATGSAVIILPGGGLQLLSWASEGGVVAEWFRDHGVAAFVLKYRLHDGSAPAEQPQSPTAQGQAPRAATGPIPAGLEVYQVEEYIQSLRTEHSPIMALEQLDAEQAVRYVKSHAAEWNIDPAKIGYLGFSAGGCIAIYAVMRNTDPSVMPAYLATMYGPPVTVMNVPENAPKLFVATRADHQNVAPGCLSLYLEWQKHGIPSEIHIYGNGKGGFGSAVNNTTSDDWKESMLHWMKVEGF
ncbi:MAG: alpha/beta hydrolase [Bacteroidales bacterium]|jgi:dienelactone hydrolase|nr:alpha/beta hydrolase [Bacteroidota bacterium]NLN98731.1 alpha/beta hydrolase [Bacteroidales bacterium]